MEAVHAPWAMFHSTGMGDNLEEVVETDDCNELLCGGVVCGILPYFVMSGAHC